MLVVCEGWVGDRDRLLHIDPSSSDHSSTSSAFWLGCSTVGHWGPKTLRLPLALNSAPCPQLTPTATWTRTDPNRLLHLVICGRMHLPPAPNSTTSTGQGDIPISSTRCTCFAVFPLIYTGASLDWRLSRGSTCYRRTWKLADEWRPSKLQHYGQNTEKSPGDLRKLAVTQTPVKNHQLPLMWKTLMSK